MNLAQWLEQIERLHPVEIDLGLSRVAAVWQALDLDLPGYVITVAGTNGKGSTVAALEAAAISAGYSTGAYTSPHIIQYNERIRLNGDMASDDQICSAFNKIEVARGDISLSYFEFGTLAALVLFAELKVDVVLLEVGLGGRMDAVNIIDCDLAIVTSIALDHFEWLGSDLEFIASEKSAISRSGNPLVIGEVPELEFWRTLSQREGPTYFYGKDFYLNDKVWHSAAQQYDVSNVSIPLNSVAIALKVLEICPLWHDRVDCRPAVLSTQVAGRMQEVSWSGRQVLFDVAHNPASIELLCEMLLQKQQRFEVVFAAMADKDLDDMLPRLLAFADSLILPQLQVGRAKKADQLAAMVPADVECHRFDSMPLAIQFLASQKSQKPILVAGSFFTVSEAMQAMGFTTINRLKE